MAVELATAYVSIVPSAKGIQGKLREELGGPAAKVGDEAGSGFMRNFGSNVVSGLDDLGGRIVSWASRGLAVAGATAGAVVGVGLWGGLQRALDREDAIVSFRRMGLDDANIVQLTDSIDQALRGTPITNPEGFALAGRFLAQGFDSADIPGLVATLADMATVGNRSFAEMGDVMVAAAGQGRITAAELRRLGDLPLGRVAAELGMTESEMRDMVSAGELTAEAFMTAFAAIDDFSGAAKDATTRVAWANLRTQIAAIGEQFLGPLLGEGGAAQRALLSLREHVAGLGPVAADLGQRFADWLVPAVQRLGEFLSGTLIPALERGWEWFQANRETLRAVAEAAAPVIAAIGGIAVAVNLVGRLTPFGIIITAVSLLATGIQYAWQNSERFREIVTGAFEAVQRVVGPIIEAVVGWVRNLADLFSGNGEPSRRMTQFREHVQSIWESISGIFRAAFDIIWSIVGPAIEQMREFWARFGDDILAVAGYVWDQIVVVIDTVLGVIHGIMEVFAGIFTGDWSRAWEGVKKIFSSVWDGIQNLMRNAVDLLRTQFADRIARLIVWARGIPGRLVAAIARFVGDAAKWARDSVASARQWFEDRIGAMVAWYREVPGRIIKALAGLAGRLAVWAREAIADMRIAFTDRVQALLEWFRGLPGRIVSALAGLASQMYQLGRDIIQGMIDGVTSMGRQAQNAVTGIAKGAVAAAKAALGVSSPSRVFAEIGRETVAGFVVGVDRDAGRAGAATADLARRAEAGARAALVPLTGSGVHSWATDAAPPSGGGVDELVELLWRMYGRGPDAVMLDGHRVGRVFADRLAAGGAV